MRGPRGRLWCETWKSGVAGIIIITTGANVVDVISIIISKPACSGAVMVVDDTADAEAISGGVAMAGTVAMDDIANIIACLRSRSGPVGGTGAVWPWNMNGVGTRRLPLTISEAAVAVAVAVAVG